MSFPDAGEISDSTITKGEQKEALENFLAATKQLIGGGDAYQQEVSGSGIVIPIKVSVLLLHSDDGTEKNITSVLTTGMDENNFVFVTVDPAYQEHVLTIEDDGVTNFRPRLFGKNTWHDDTKQFVMDGLNGQWIVFRNSGDIAYEVCRGYGMEQRQRTVFENVAGNYSFYVPSGVDRLFLEIVGGAGGGGGGSDGVTGGVSGGDGILTTIQNALEWTHTAYGGIGGVGGSASGLGGAAGATEDVSSASRGGAPGQHGIAATTVSGGPGEVGPIGTRSGNGGFGNGGGGAGGGGSIHSIFVEAEVEPSDLIEITIGAGGSAGSGSAGNGQAGSDGAVLIRW